MTDVWDSVQRLDSADENVSKYVFTLDDAVAETVLYRYPDYETRTVICCSTQSGCPVGCSFCGAGDYFVRSLTAEEIISQVTHMFEDRDIDPARVDKLQIMFMSMGEPLLNWGAVERAIVWLYREYPHAALLVSTSAPRVSYEPIRGLSIAVPTLGLQFSVHESTDEARNKLVPFEAKLTLEEIAREGERWYRATGRQPFFNYCVHDENTSVEDADRLFELFNADIWQATISVICERDETVARAHERQRDLTLGFQELLLERGFSTRLFDPAGQDDIGGGCGQLWYVQKWMNEHPDQVHSSAGGRARS